MPAVTVTVEPYPFEGATGIEVEEATSYGWVNVLDTSDIGTFPNYTTEYSVTATSTSYKFRYRWQLSLGETSWLDVQDVPVGATAEIEARLTQAVLAKAIRLYALPEAPFGTHGEMTEFGMAKVLPDYQIIEILSGLLRINWDVDPTTLVTVADVVRAIGYDDLTADKDADIQRAIDSAASWVADYILGGVAVV